MWLVYTVWWIGYREQTPRYLSGGGEVVLVAVSCSGAETLLSARFDAILEVAGGRGVSEGR